MKQTTMNRTLRTVCTVLAAAALAAGRVSVRRGRSPRRSGVGRGWVRSSPVSYRADEKEHSDDALQPAGRDRRIHSVWKQPHGRSRLSYAGGCAPFPFHDAGRYHHVRSASNRCSSSYYGVSFSSSCCIQDASGLLSVLFVLFVLFVVLVLYREYIVPVVAIASIPTATIHEGRTIQIPHQSTDNHLVTS